MLYDSKDLREWKMHNDQVKKERLSRKNAWISPDRDSYQGLGCGRGRKSCRVCSGTGKALGKGKGSMRNRHQTTMECIACDF